MCGAACSSPAACQNCSTSAQALPAAEMMSARAQCAASMAGAVLRRSTHAPLVLFKMHSCTLPGCYSPGNSSAHSFHWGKHCEAQHSPLISSGLAKRGQVRCMAQPRKKLPDKSVDIRCKGCDAKLYKYRKGGKGSLVKCYVERITHDYTAGDLRCPNCGAEFARESLVHGRPAHKIVGGKVYMK